MASVFKTSDNVSDGDLVALLDKDTVVAAVAGDMKDIVGVVNQKAPIVIRALNEATSSARTVFVSTSGEVKVNIAKASDDIRSGDLIAVSNIPGKAIKAQKSSHGQIIGIALEDYKRGSKLPISLQVGGASKEGALGMLFSKPIFSTLEAIKAVGSASKLFRYIIAGVLVTATVFTTFITLGRSMVKGLESVGRNPLSKHVVQSMLAYNAFLIAAINIGVIAIAFIIVQI